MTSARFTLPPTTGLVFQPVVATDDDSWTVDDARLLGSQCAAPWRLDDADQWDLIEQAGGEFGRYAPPAIPSYGWTDENSHVVAPVLAAIADGWNMVRVACRDRRPSAELTVVRIDIWPIEGPAGRQIIKQGAARPTPARLEVPEGPGTSDAVGVTLGAQT